MLSGSCWYTLRTRHSHGPQDELCQTFENEGQEKDFRPLDKISELLGTDSEPDANAFWQKVRDKPGCAAYATAVRGRQCS